MKYRWMVVFLGCLTYFAAAVIGEDVCRQLRYEPEIQDKRLEGHAIRSLQVDDPQKCGIECFVEQLCLSYNLGPPQIGKHLCELSDSDAIRHPMDLIPSPGFIYQGTKNACSSSPCPSQANCISLSETDFRCVCPKGYTGDNCDTDVNECAIGAHSCHPNANCTNAPGSYHCTCRQGFAGDGSTCNDIDECLGSPCDANATCTNSPGSYHCTCDAGFYGDGHVCMPAGTDCRTLKNSYSDAVSGLYHLHPGDPNNIIKAYCDMTSFGGGWTMCYTTDEYADPKDETTYDENLPYGTDGYRTNCNDIEFSEIVFINEETGEKEYFTTKSGAKMKLISSYGDSAQPQGLWDSHGLADSSYSYQLLICDHAFYSGFHVSGYTNCYKQCANWCGDKSSPYFRTSATDSKYSGVAFNANGHSPNVVPKKLVSVGLR